MRSFTPYLLLLAIACAHEPVSRDSSPTPTTGSATLPHMEPPAAPPPAFLSVHRADKLMREGKPAEALPLYLQAWEVGNQQANTAYSLACATALLGKRDEAMTWLERAVEKSYRDAEWMQQDEDLVSLRELPAFSTLMQRIPTLPPPTRDEGSHPELRRLVTEDQADRRAGPITAEKWKEISARDRQRRQRVSELLSAGAAKTASDFYAAALVFQHGDTPEDFARARELAAESARRGHPNGLWLTAAAWDRWLMNAGQPQRFGTQFRLDPTTHQPSLYPVDPSVTDAERERWGFPPLSEIAAGM